MHPVSAPVGVQNDELSVFRERLAEVGLAGTGHCKDEEGHMLVWYG